MDYLTAQVTDVFDLAFIQKLNSPGIVYNYYGQGVINKRINVVPEWSAVDLLEQIEAGYQRSVEARDKINQ